MPEQRDRLEREIEEILGKIEQFPSASERRARARRKATGRVGDGLARRQRTLLGWLSRISMSEVMLLSFALILGSFFFRRFSPLAMQWVLYAGIVLFVASFAVLVFNRRGGGGASAAGYWRGRQIEYRSPSITARLRRWFGSRRGTSGRGGPR